jgi:DNA-binding CsgD family transcriptional regulator
VFVSSRVRTDIAALCDEGLSTPDIARRLGLAPTTVAYHGPRLSAAEGPEDEAVMAPPAPAARGHVSTRNAVAALLEAGMTRAEIARQLGLAKGTVSYHARRLHRDIDERCARRYDWDVIQAFYDEGHSVRECIAQFGFSSASWFDAVKRGVIVARRAGMPIEELLASGTYRGRYHLKARLITEGLKENRCERCGIAEWQGQPITLALHHINGVRDDNAWRTSRFCARTATVRLTPSPAATAARAPARRRSGRVLPGIRASRGPSTGRPAPRRGRRSRSRRR